MNESDDMSIVESPEEAPVKPRPKPIDDGEMDITPMIDITFLLLIFFLVASHVGENPEVLLPPARHGVAVPIATSTYLTLDAEADRQLILFRGEEKDPAQRLAGTPEQQEEQVLAFVKEGLSQSPRKDHVVINAARRVKHRDVSRIGQAAAKAGEIKLYVAVLEED